MKKVWIMILCVLLFSGCGKVDFETMSDADDIPVIAVPATLLIDLPTDAAVSAMKGTSGTLYFCNGYEIMIETMSSGNLSATVETLTGFSEDELELIKTERCGVSCYETAWSAAGEAGDQVGRILILDDDRFHYCITVMTKAENTADCSAQWCELFDSVKLAES